MDEKLRKKYCPMTETIFYTLLALLEPNHGYGIMKFVKELTKERVKWEPEPCTQCWDVWWRIR